MLVEVATGEVIDKYNILEIKRERISDPAKLIEIQNELDTLSACKLIIRKHRSIYKLLGVVNRDIWDITNIVKSLKPTDPSYAEYAHQIFELNQKRFRIKNHFNIIDGSCIKEQKSYKLDVCLLKIPAHYDIYAKLAELNYLLISYDNLIIDCPNPHIYTQITRIYNNPGLLKPDSLPGLPIKETLNLEEYELNPADKNKYMMEPITYIAGGLLGDFIQQLSVINELFLKTGRRGILYIANIGDAFRTGLETTYKDTYDIVKSQAYIEDYKIYNDEPLESMEVNLSAWRNSRLLYKTSWHEIFKSVYHVEWGTHAWLKVSETDPAWQSKIIINTTHIRFTNRINYHEIIKTYGLANIIYVSFNESEYDYFKQKTGITTIPFYKPATLNELVKIINSCTLFIGSLSAPLSIAHAMYKPRIMGLCTYSEGCITHVKQLESILLNMTVI